MSVLEWDAQRKRDFRYRRGRDLAPIVVAGWLVRLPVLIGYLRGLTRLRVRLSPRARDTWRVSAESTTPDLVERVRGFVKAASPEDLNAMLSSYAPHVVWEAVDLGTTFEGVAAIRGFLEEWLSGYEMYEIEPEEILDLGSGVVSAVTRQSGRPAGSIGGALVQEVWIYLFVWVEGKVARVAVYRDIAEGRAAAERLAEERAKSA